MVVSVPRVSLHLRVRDDHQPITSLTWAEAVGDEADEMGNMRKVKELLLLVGAGLLQKKCDASLPKHTRPIPNFHDCIVVVVARCVHHNRN